MAGLRPQHKRFVAEYLIDSNATQAYIRAGYSRKGADVGALRLLARPEIAAAVTAGQRKLLEKLELKADQVIQEIARIAVSDVRGLFDDAGRLRAVKDLPAHLAATIASVEVVTRGAVGQKGKTGKVERIHKIRFWNKLSALELLAKRLGLIKEQHEHSGTNGAPIRVSFGGRYRPGADGTTPRS